MEPADPQQAAAYRRLKDLQQGLEDREFRRGARLPFMRMRETVQSQMDIDDAGERLEQAVLDARRLGMSWDVIGDAMYMNAQDAEAHYGDVDGRI